MNFTIYLFRVNSIYRVSTLAIVSMNINNSSFKRPNVPNSNSSPCSHIVLIITKLPIFRENPKTFLVRGLQILQISREALSAWKHSWDSFIILMGFFSFSCLVAYELLSNNSITNIEGFAFPALQMWQFPYNPIHFSYHSRGNWNRTDSSWYNL